MNSITHIEARLLAFLRDRRYCDLEITAETDLFDAGVLDSLMLLDLILHIQEVFGVTAVAADVTKKNFCSAAALARWVSARVNGFHKAA
jgi:acyl carrier protein